MAPKHNPDSIATDCRLDVLKDGWTILVISTFKDGKNVGINIYKANDHKQLE